MNIKIINFVNSKLTPATIQRGWVCLKELASILNADERTIRRWNSDRRKGNTSVGIPSMKVNGKHMYIIEDVYEYFAKDYI